jgi:hypothetical protein
LRQDFLMIYNDDIYDLSFIKFNIEKVRTAYDNLLTQIDHTQELVKAISLNKVPNDNKPDQRGIFWIQDKNHNEVQREKYVNEKAYNELIPEIQNTHFEYMYKELSRYFELGRMRLLLLEPRNSLSFHKDPQPRLHIPIITNPGCLLIIENFATHLVADGSVYYTNTKKYHTALNGGEANRIHFVATILNTKEPN